MGLRVGGADGEAEGEAVGALVGARVGGVEVTPVSPWLSPSVVVVPPAGVDPEPPPLLPTSSPPTTATTTATITKATIARTRTAVAVYSADRRLYQGRFMGGPIIQS